MHPSARGTDNASSGGSYHYFRVFDVNIPVNANTRLTWLAYPTNNLSRYVSVDLVMTDGSNLRDAGATDINGVSMHPGAGRGTVNTWQKQTCFIGNWLNGKTIDRIMIAYDHGADVGAFKTYIDDIVIKDTTQSFALAAFKTQSEEESLVQIFPQPANKTATVSISNWTGNERLELLNVDGKSLLRQQATSSRTELPVQAYPAGIYILRVERNGKFIVKKLIITR
ncbi:T9SS type A sorting domain-containing protein [Chitinophaga barathri]|uniref:T9SS type A sorting domain-containing protein n=1 Tax=Chitinophaga barathri TaxID=1647451 RepID=UPI0019D4B248|nr:T9SS type A sorting domain-containing protein [Chitinophaga barathri]